MQASSVRPVEIFLVEDDEEDRIAFERALEKSKVINRLSIAKDGQEAIDFLQRKGSFKDAPRPDLILLDMNLPKKNGKDVLAEIRKDPQIMDIPVTIMTSSTAEEDVVRSYQLGANCYIQKPMDFERLKEIVTTIDRFWFGVVTLPSKNR